MKDHEAIIKWKHLPYIRILPVFTAGILSGWYLKDQAGHRPEFFLLPAVILALAVCYLPCKKAGCTYLPPMLCLYFASAMLYMADRGPGLQREMDFNGPATVITSLEERNKTYKTTLALSLAINDGKDPKRIKSIAYIRKSPLSGVLLPGDRIMVNSRIQTLKPPDLPGQFNYAQYLERRNITGSTFIDSSKWYLMTETALGYGLLRRSALLRSFLEESLERYIPADECALIKAMVLGLRSGLDDQTRSSFAEAGIMHILAVSGLHVSIIWLLISTTLRPFTRKGRIVKITGIFTEVAVIWGFAILTGLGPAVQRAAFMFSLLSISKISALKGHTINLTAASAVLLMIIRPENLFEAGFQLSYSAVFGILLFYRRIKSIFYFRNRLLNYFWSLEAVSFSAVIGTAPLSIYYFHQFPLVFPITNLIAVPAAFIIVSTTVIMFIASGTGMALISAILGRILSLITGLLIEATHFISDRPNSSIKMIYLDHTETILLYLLTLFCLAMLSSLSKLRLLLPWSLMILILFLVYRGLDSSVEFNRNEAYMITDTYSEDSRTCLANAGKLQYILYSQECDECYNITLNGNHKYNRINKIDSVFSPATYIDSLFIRLSPSSEN